jgi:hypothetical protein
MALSSDKKTQVKEVLKESLANKFETYHPETENMPFHYRLLGKDRMALFSFIQSLNTTFGTSIYEPVAKAIAQGRFKRVETQADPYLHISSNAQAAIQNIVDDISTAIREPDKEKELGEIRAVCRSGEMKTVKHRKIDVLVQDKNDQLFLMDIKTVKPNIGNFEDFKRMLLSWAAAEMARNPGVNVQTIIAIPYNPYEPEPYNRWTMRGMFDLKNEILVAEEMWDFLGGPGAYQDLLDCFEMAGIELRSVIDNYFARFRNH